MNRRAEQQIIKMLFSVFDNLAMFFLCFFSFLILPFSFTNAAIDPTLQLRFVMLSFLSLVLGSWFFTKSNEQQSLTFTSMVHRKIFWVWGIFFLLASISLIGSINKGEGLFALLNIFLTGSFFFICSLTFYQYSKDLTILSQWAVVAGIGLVFLGLTGRYWHTDAVLFKVFFLKSIMINKNLYASSLFLLIPFIIPNIISKQKIWCKTSIILLPVLCITILFSMSRAIYLATIFAAIPSIMMLFRSQFKPDFKKQPVQIITLRIIFIIITMVSLTWICIFVIQPVKDSKSVELRLNIWKNTIQMIQDNLIFGVGPGQWRLALPKYGGSGMINRNSAANIETLPQRPHNDFLWVAAETGIAGALFYLIFFGMLYYYAVKIIDKANTNQKVLALSMLFGINGYLIIAMFSYPRERPLHSLLLMFMAAVIVSQYHQLYPKTIPKWRKIIIIIMKSAILTLLTICFLVSGLRLYSEVQFKKALQARNQRKPQQVINLIDKTFLPVYSIDPFGVPLSWYRGMAHYNLNNLPAALDDFNRALYYHPLHSYSHNNLAIIKDKSDRK